MIARWLDYLIAGHDADTMPPEWMVTKLPEHDRWTRAQQQPGMALIVADSAEMARRTFWERVAAKRTTQPSKVAQFGRRQA